MNPMKSKSLFPTLYLNPFPSSPLVRKSFAETADEVFDSLFTDLFSNQREIKNTLISKTKYPKVDIDKVTEDNGEEKLVFSVAVPGIDEDKIKVDADFDNSSLSISYSKEEQKEIRKTEKICNELSHASFFRSWTIPKETIQFESEKDIKAGIKNGILSISLNYIQNKKETPKEKSKSIPISKS